MNTGPDRDYLKGLVRSAQEGDLRAYGKIFRSSYRGIYDYIARRVGNEKDAEDLTMQVFLKGLDRIDTYEERGYTIRSWLFRIAHNLVVDHFRANRESAEPYVAGSMVDDSALPEDELISRERTEDLKRRVLELPQAQAEVLYLRFLSDLSVSETAWVLGKKEVTVRTLQFKGLKNLKKDLEEER